MKYSRFVPNAAGERAVIDTVDHVRAHMSSVADSDDDPDTLADDVAIEYIYQDDGVMIIGSLDAVPNAPYLDPEYVPVDDGEFEFTPWSEK